MKANYFFLVLCLFVQKTFFAQTTERIQDGSFTNRSASWVLPTFSNFTNNFAVITDNCYRSADKYAYFRPNNNSYGQLYQDFTIPANTVSVAVEFYASISTLESANAIARDTLVVGVYSVATGYHFIYLTNKNAHIFGTNNCPSTYQKWTFSLPAIFLNKAQQQNVGLYFEAWNSNDVFPTVFRIDDVSVKTTVQTPCIAWQNGEMPADPNVFNAMEHLCGLKVIGSQQVFNDINQFLYTTELAIRCLNGIKSYDGLDVPRPSDFFPTPIVDIEGLATSEQKNAMKAALYLDYEDGIPPLARTAFNSTAYFEVQRVMMLKAILEFLNIPPDNSSGVPSNMPSDISASNPYFGYVKKALSMGLLDAPFVFFNGNFAPEQRVLKYEFYLLLSRALRIAPRPAISNNSYFVPNVYGLKNLGLRTGASDGVFENYEESSFNLPSGGLSLNFSHNYLSHLTELPYKVFNSVYEGEVEKQKIFPLGFGWNHSYNILIQKVSNYGALSNEAYLIRYPNGQIHTVNGQTRKYETAGVKNEFFYNGNNITIQTPDKMTYTFYQDVNYSSFYNLTQIEDRNGNKIYLTYLTSNDLGTPITRLVNVQDAVANRQLLFTYKPNSNYIASVRDPQRTVSFDVNLTTSDLKSYTDANGYVTNYGYNFQGSYSSHLLTSIRRPKGNTLTTVNYGTNYGDRRKLQKVQSGTYSLDVSFTPTYTTTGIKTSSTVALTQNGQTYRSKYENNQLGQPTSITTPQDATVVVTYDEPNNPTLPKTINDQSTGVIETFRYDDKGNVLFHEKNGNGDIISETMTYTPTFNDLASHTDFNGNTTTYSYTPDGKNLKSINEPNNVTTTFERNTNGNLTRAINPSGISTRYRYNNYGNLDSISIDGTNIAASAKYDPLSRLQFLTNPNGVKKEISYDYNDNILSVTEDAGSVRPLKTAYMYDPNNNLTKITDARGNSTQLEYNATTDDLEKETFGSFYKTWDYNTDGTLRTFTNKNGTSFTNVYNSTSGLAGLLQSDGYATYGYNSITKALNSIARNGKSINYEYNLLQRIGSIRYMTDNIPNNHVDYEYDKNGNITRLTYPNGRVFTYKYNANNRLIQILDWENKSLVDYAYLPDGRLDFEILGNKTKVVYGYEANSARLISITNQKSSGAIIAAFSCTLDNVGNHKTETRNVPTRPNQNDIFSDIASYGYDNMNRMSLAAGTIHSYKPNGTQSNGINSTFTWDDRDNLISRVTNGITTNYEYDGLENRRRVGNTAYALDILNGSNVLAEYNATTQTPTKMYVHGLGLVCSIDPFTLEKIFYHYDFRGSTIALTNMSEDTVKTYQYGAFGERSTIDNFGASSQPFQYVGKYGVMHEDKDLLFMRNRYYNPNTGRFLSEDPVWSTNLYPYADNNPLVNIDPKGTNPFLIAAGIGAGIELFSYSVDNHYDGFTWKGASYSVLKGATSGSASLLHPAAGALTTGVFKWSETYEETDGNMKTALGDGIKATAINYSVGKAFDSKFVNVSVNSSVKAINSGYNSAFGYDKSTILSKNGLIKLSSRAGSSIKNAVKNTFSSFAEWYIQIKNQKK